jgi:hypothetical protein
MSMSVPPTGFEPVFPDFESFKILYTTARLATLIPDPCNCVEDLQSNTRHRGMAVKFSRCWHQDGCCLWKDQADNHGSEVLASIRKPNNILIDQLAWRIGWGDGTCKEGLAQPTAQFRILKEAVEGDFHKCLKPKCLHCIKVVDFS